MIQCTYMCGVMHTKYTQDMCLMPYASQVGAAADVLHEVPPRRTQPLLASASKSSIGHTEAAAGAMGLAHTLVGLSHAIMQPVMHLRAVNPFLDARLRDNTWALPRQAAGLPSSPETHPAGPAGTLVTGVSSFAFMVRGCCMESPAAVQAIPCGHRSNTHTRALAFVWRK
jgi:hypothetical protein